MNVFLLYNKIQYVVSKRYVKNKEKDMIIKTLNIIKKTLDSNKDIIVINEISDIINNQYMKSYDRYVISKLNPKLDKIIKLYITQQETLYDINNTNNLVEINPESYNVHLLFANQKYAFELALKDKELTIIRESKEKELTIIRESKEKELALKDKEIRKLELKLEIMRESRNSSTKKRKNIIKL